LEIYIAIEKQFLVISQEAALRLTVKLLAYRRNNLTIFQDFLAGKQVY
jgi:hypothetical protein